jgi:hypothetical protein
MGQRQSRATGRRRVGGVESQPVGSEPATVRGASLPSRPSRARRGARANMINRHRAPWASRSWCKVAAGWALATSMLSGALVLLVLAVEADPTYRVHAERTEMRTSPTAAPESELTGKLTWPHLASGAGAAGPTGAVAADPAQASPARPAWPTRTTPPTTPGRSTTPTAPHQTTTPTAPHQTTTPTGSSPSPAPGGTDAAPAGSYGCAAALAWLSGHAAPGFQLICPGYALGTRP